MLRGHNCDVWRMVATELIRKNTYTMWVEQGTGTPVRYTMVGYDTLLGSHYDRYYLDYNGYVVTPIPPVTFDLPTGDVWKETRSFLCVITHFSNKFFYIHLLLVRLDQKFYQRAWSIKQINHSGELPSLNLYHRYCKNTTQTWLRLSMIPTTYQRKQ